jgi:hypothetical protein
MPIFSNIDEVMDAIEHAIDSFGMDTDDLGNRLAQGQAHAIHERAESGEGSEGAWDRNRASTIRRKGFDKPNYETDQMMSEASLLGHVDVSREKLEMQYGTGTAVVSEHRSAKWVLTDTQKAALAHEGQSHLLIKRPFYALTEEDQQRILEMTGETLADHLRTELGGT